MIAGHQVDAAMFSYIAKHIDADTFKLLLKAEPELTFDKSFAIVQIECRRKARNKIPELLQHDQFLFGRAISAEQCTHEEVAKFHASHFLPNDQVLDMTMGLGVDTYYISRIVQSVTTIEIDAETAETGRHNFSFLASNVEVVHGDSVEYLKNLDSEKRFDSIFIDPARRGDNNRRLYGLADCLPNVLSLLPLIKQHCKRLYIKASPMLDVTQSIKDLESDLTDVWAVSIKNECKELLFKLDFETPHSNVNLHALNHDGSGWQEFTTSANELGISTSHIIPEVGNFLYEPNASIMKLGCYNAVEQTLDLKQIAQNSHLMISNELIEEFPGRRFKILEITPFKDQVLKQLTKRIKQANIATRNFRLNADAVRKRLRMNDGGNIYIFATTLTSGEQTLLVCEKIT